MAGNSNLPPIVHTLATPRCATTCCAQSAGNRSLQAIIACWSMLLNRRLVTSARRIPIDYVPPSGDVIGTAILILQVVSMLPNVDAHDRRVAMHQGAVLIGSA